MRKGGGSGAERTGGQRQTDTDRDTCGMGRLALTIIRHPSNGPAKRITTTRTADRRVCGCALLSLWKFRHLKLHKLLSNHPFVDCLHCCSYASSPAMEPCQMCHQGKQRSLARQFYPTVNSILLIEGAWLIVHERERKPFRYNLSNT